MKQNIRFYIIFISAFFLLSYQTLYAEQKTVSNNPSLSENIDPYMQGLVQIETIFEEYSYDHPWNRPKLARAGGTGFIISGNRIITNAHVVNRAKLIRVQRPNQRRDYEATIRTIAHDCDLAMLEVKEKVFFKGAVSLEIGDEPAINSPVMVMGFPIGGDRVSITRGIVSRKDMDTYSHSQVDAHLTIQVDAAINPGNSGGPALQNGKVIGVAFQVFTKGESLGYLIPPIVVNRFLDDVKDGRYDGYTEFGVQDRNTLNPTIIWAIGLKDKVSYPDTGVYVYNVIPGSSADGHIRPGDLLVRVNGHLLTSTGEVDVDGSLQPFTQLLDNFAPGQKIEVELFRDQKRKRITFPARRAPILDMQRRNQSQPPPYMVVGGMVFQPVDGDLMEDKLRTWMQGNHLDVIYRFRYYLARKIYKQVDYDIVLTGRLGDRINIYSQHYVNGIVEAVNGVKVRNMSQFADQLHKALQKETYLIIAFRNIPIPLVMRSVDVKESDKRILAAYGIPDALRLPHGEQNEK